MDHPVIGLSANISKPGSAVLTQRLARDLRAGGARVVLEQDTAAAAGEAGGLPLFAVAEQCRLLVVLGGDGTILRTVQQLGAGVKPVAAVNIGRLGFLTTGTADEAAAIVEAVLTGAYEISERSVLEAEFTAHGGEVRTQAALNEAVVSRGAISRMVRLNVTVDGQFVNGYSGDGLIVSTPTGSTAYNLSAGGPIVTPQAGVFCVTPICPHAIGSQGFVVNDSARIELTAAGTMEELLLNLDGGAPIPLCREAPVKLRRAGWTVPLVQMPGSSFYGVLRQKLMWNGSSV
jgi:NAD+ kinase